MAVGGRGQASLRVNWPEIQDNAVLSADEKTLTETSAWFTLNATRMSGGSGIVGMWQWPGGALILTIRPDGAFSAGPINGRWQAANLGERTYLLYGRPRRTPACWPPTARSSPVPTSTEISLPPGKNRASGSVVRTVTCVQREIPTAFGQVRGGEF